MRKPNKSHRIIVLGAGISGLAAAKELQSRGVNSYTLEACPSVGGLTRTVHVGEFCFDYTGHLLHLAQHDTPAALPHASLNDVDWQRIERRSYAYIGNKLVPAPVQYHMGDLPEPFKSQCIDAYSLRSKSAISGTSNLRDWIISGFGDKLADNFLIPQNEKTLGIKLEQLSADALKRFFPPPDDGLVRSGFTSQKHTPKTYNSQFWYPKTGGIERLVKGLSSGLNNLRCQERIVGIDPGEHTLHTNTGRTWQWSQLISSLPLKTFCLMTLDDQLHELAKFMTHSSTICFNIGVRGTVSEAIGDAQWIYVPDRSLPFYRVGVYSNISRGMSPPDCTGMYVEVGVSPEKLQTVDISGDLQTRVMTALQDLGWVIPKNIICSVIHVIPCAYVHHTNEAEQAVAAAISRLEENDVYPIGRYGNWDYTSMEDSILSGIETAQRVSL